MRRREFLALLAGSTATPACVRAQPYGQTLRRIGYLGTGADDTPLVEALRDGLRALGWIEGGNLVVEYRFAEGRLDRLPGLAAELVGLGVELIAASPTPATLAARNATASIPIVGISFDNPVQNGLVASLARPGGNVTGLSYSVGPEIFGKDLELLREILPGIRRVAVLSNPLLGPNHALMMNNVETAGRSLGMDLLLVEARGPDEFDDAFATMIRERVGALFVFGAPMFGVNRARLAELAAQHRLPTIYTNRPFVDAGGLMSYAPSFSEIGGRAATYVDKVLKGTNPADLPVEQPTRFELIINLRAARRIGLHMPPSLLGRADEVIE